MGYNWHILKSTITGHHYASMEVLPDEDLIANLMAAKHAFKQGGGDKDFLLDTVNQWRKEAARRHIVIGPRKVSPWLGGQPGKPVLLGVAFTCPGCGELHAVTTAGKNAAGSQWTWNGDYANPTISPSIMRQEHGKTLCHVIVKEGKALFFSDCQHSLKGSEVDLPEC